MPGFLHERGLRGARSLWAFSALAVAIGSAGCYESHLRGPPPCATVYLPIEGALERVDDVDLLLLVDNSNSMAGEQALLATELPRMFEALASGDLDGDGVRDARPFASIHVGVVTSDLGAGSSPPPGMDGVVPSCDPGLGDDGILRTIGRTELAGCVASYPGVFEFSGDDAAGAFAADVSCVANMGTGGCGFEQQLEATLEAVSPGGLRSWTAATYEPPIFTEGRAGHADGPNAGFLRPSSILALVVLTDEEDCSVPDYSIFYRDPRFSSVGLNLRCFTFPEHLYPIERYVDGFLGLRRSSSRLVFAAIAGIPTDLVADDPAGYARALADPRMIETPDPSMSPPTRVLPSCSTADGGEASPPRRIVEVADGLARAGAMTTVQSICAGDFRPAIERIATLIADPGGCLPRPVERGPDGTSACELLERLPPPGAGVPVVGCAALGLISAGVEPTDHGPRELCRVPAIAPAEGEAHGGSGTGWYLDVAPGADDGCAMPGAGRIALSRMSAALGASWYFACPHSEILTSEGLPPEAPVGSPCGARWGESGLDCASTLVPSEADVDGDGLPDVLSCDLASSTCVGSCRSDGDCASAGLVGYRCDRTELGEVLGLVPGEPGYTTAPRDVCVRDVCQ